MKNVSPYFRESLVFQLRTIRKRKLIAGNPKTFFFLTKLGKKIALETAKTFR